MGVPVHEYTNIKYPDPVLLVQNHIQFHQNKGKIPDYQPLRYHPVFRSIFIPFQNTRLAASQKREVLNDQAFAPA